MIAEYNKIDVNNDDKLVIQAKIDAIKKALSNGEIGQDEFNAEKAEIESKITEKG